MIGRPGNDGGMVGRPGNDSGMIGRPGNDCKSLLNFTVNSTLDKSNNYVSLSTTIIIIAQSILCNNTLLSLINCFNQLVFIYNACN